MKIYESAVRAAEESRTHRAKSRYRVRVLHRGKPVLAQILYEKGDYRKAVGYRANNTVTVTVNDVAKAGQVIDAALSSGATDVNGLSFGLKDAKSVRNTALQMAVQDARSKADAIAAALGVKIVGIQNVKEDGGNFARYEVANARLAKLDGAAMADTPVNAGTVEVNAEVHIDFQIQ